MSIKKIIFSRHSKRRMKLYGISEADVKIVLKNGKKELIENRSIFTLKIRKFKFPLKVVAEREENNIYIITAYPLKRGLEK